MAGKEDDERETADTAGEIVHWWKVVYIPRLKSVPEHLCNHGV